MSLRKLIEKHGIENVYAFIELDQVVWCWETEFATIFSKPAKILCRINTERYDPRKDHKVSFSPVETRWKGIYQSRVDFYISDFDMINIPTFVKV